MEFSSFAEFIAMGTHGPYVWMSYGFTAVLVAWNIAQPILRRRRLLKEQAQRLRREKKHAPSA